MKTADTSFKYLWPFSYHQALMGYIQELIVVLGHETTTATFLKINFRIAIRQNISREILELTLPSHSWLKQINNKKPIAK